MLLGVAEQLMLREPGVPVPQAIHPMQCSGAASPGCTQGCIQSVSSGQDAASQKHLSFLICLSCHRCFWFFWGEGGGFLFAPPFFFFNKRGKSLFRYVLGSFSPLPCGLNNEDQLCMNFQEKRATFTFLKVFSFLLFNPAACYCSLSCLSL